MADAIQDAVDVIEKEEPETEANSQRQITGQKYGEGKIMQGVMQARIQHFEKKDIE